MSSNPDVQHFSTQPPQSADDDLSKIATYEEVKDLPNKNILLIDVREPQELIDTGVIPTSINIPRKFYNYSLILYHPHEKSQ
jgi:rhodanese-related sulfurtransferase